EKKERETLYKRLQDGRPYLLKAQEEEKHFTVSIDTAEKHLEDLKNTRVDTSVLLALEAWYQGDENMQHHITELEAQIQTNRDEIAKIEEVFEKQTLAIDEWEADLMQQETDINNRFASLKQEDTHLKVQAKLSEFAHNLMEGHHCPISRALD